MPPTGARSVFGLRALFLYSISVQEVHGEFAASHLAAGQELQQSHGTTRDQREALIIDGLAVIDEFNTVGLD